jgi:hypothetical protein
MIPDIRLGTVAQVALAGACRIKSDERKINGQAANVIDKLDPELLRYEAEKVESSLASMDGERRTRGSRKFLATCFRATGGALN